MHAAADGFAACNVNIWTTAEYVSSLFHLAIIIGFYNSKLLTKIVTTTWLNIYEGIYN